MNKFPSTPHLTNLGSNPIRGDKVMTEPERNEFLRHYITIEEKIDGANLGISFDEHGEILLQNRGNYLNFPYLRQWKKLPSWIEKRMDKLFDILSNRYIMYGEWCYAKHSITYSLLSDWFICFDLYDKKENKFLSSVRRNTLLIGSGIESIVELSSGYFSLPNLVQLLSTSYYSNELAEGLYLRVNNDRWLETRAKLVRPQFIQNIEQHWSKQSLKENKIRIKPVKSNNN